MIDRDKESVTRREALSREEIEAQTQNGYRSGRTRSRAPQRMIPFLILAFIAAIIARQEIPAVADWWEKTFSPEQWQMKQTCRDAAVEMSSNRAFARVIENGDVHETEDGFYLDRLVLGEMGQDGVEQRVEYTCYLSGARELVRLNRLDESAPTAVP